jgi:nicotinate-nucleotide adenylyltransferase
MMTEQSITPAMLDALREHVRGMMSEKRYAHTAAVERMVVRLGEIYCPELIPELCAAALLHDITKEESLEKQLQLCQTFDIILEPTATLAPKTLHARTAAALIPVQFPAFATETVIRAVRFHTTGCKDMTIADKLVYLADYIDDSRKFPDCVRLRDYFWSAEPQNMDTDARLAHLRDTLILSFDMTIRGLLDDGVPVGLYSIMARDALLVERAKD